MPDNRDPNQYIPPSSPELLEEPLLKVPEKEEKVRLLAPMAPNTLFKHEEGNVKYFVMCGDPVGKLHRGNYKVLIVDENGTPPHIQEFSENLKDLQSFFERQDLPEIISSHLNEAAKRLAIIEEYRTPAPTGKQKRRERRAKNRKKY